MRGIELPERTEDFTADPVELFFDLAFVFAFSQLVSHIVHHPTWTGFGETVLLFCLVWLPWTQFTWSANAVSGNARSVRLVFLLATVASVPMGAAVTTAFDDGGTVFAVSASVILLMGLALLAVGLESGSKEFASAVSYAVPNIAAVVVMILGSLLEDRARVLMWILALVVVVAGTLRAGSRVWVMRPGHFAERHGLIVIIALGEVVVALGIAIAEPLREGAGLTSSTVWALIGSGVLVGLLWWGYFDRVGPAFEHRAESRVDVEAGRFARDVYTYVHAPLVLGVILVAAALEEVSLHPKAPLPDPFRWLLLAGLVAILLSVVIGVFRAFRVVPKERLVCAGVLAMLVAVSASWDAVALLLAIDVVLFAALVAEHIRVEQTFVQERQDASQQPS